MPENALKHLGNCIRTARNECGLTQQELADQTGRGLRHIQNIEKGKINPSYEVLSVLIKRLGISADIPNRLISTDNNRCGGQTFSGQIYGLHRR